jgi:hypothetical protein
VPEFVLFHRHFSVLTMSKECPGVSAEMQWQATIDKGKGGDLDGGKKRRMAATRFAS